MGRSRWRSSRSAEGPMLVSTVRGCEQTPEALQLDMPLRATFAPFDEVELLVFEPATASATGTTK